MIGSFLDFTGPALRMFVTRVRGEEVWQNRPLSGRTEGCTDAQVLRPWRVYETVGVAWSRVSFG
jgi:hypothetical protein